MTEKDKEWSIGEILLFILVIVIILVTLGAALSLAGESREEVVIEDEEKKRKRLSELDALITHLAAKRTALALREKRVFIWLRVFFSITIAIMNLLYWHLWTSEKSLSSMLNFNEAGLLGYSFIAFMISGTPSRFLIALKRGMSKWLKRNHIDTLTELEEYERERDGLRSELYQKV